MAYIDLRKLHLAIKANDLKAFEY